MNAYYERTILDAEPAELIRMVYQRAIDCVRDARRHLREGRIPERTIEVSRAYAALAELQGSLRPEAAPELAARMGSLYDYMQERLVVAQFQQLDAPLAEVQALLGTLSEAWGAVVRETQMAVSA